MSSRLTNVVATQFVAQGGSAIVTQLNQMSQATGSFFNRLSDTSRMSERFNNQWRAIGTTIRYAIAGQAVFGLTRMVSQLKDVQQQMGLIQSLGTQPGPGGTSVGFSNRDVDRLSGQLQTVALETITPINDINNAAINLLSTIQDVKPGDIPQILTDIAEAAKLSQTPIEDLTQAATTMNIAFGRANSAANIGQFSRMWNAMIGLAPGGIRAAPELAKQLPNVSTVFQQGLSPNVNPKTAQAQMMSLVLGSLRFGATPSTASRGLAYFLQSLETPASANAKTALEGIGINPQSVRRQGIYATTIKFLRHISGNMSKTQLKQLQAIPEDQLEGMSALPGVAPNQMTFLRTSLGRIHAVRTAIVLASQLQERGGVASLQEDLNALEGYQSDEIKDTHSLSVGWQKFRDRSKLADAANALNVISLDMAKSIEPILNFAATGVRGFAGFAHGVAQHHRTLTQAAALSGAGFIAALSIGRWTGVAQRFPGLSKIPGLGRLLGASPGNAFVRANAIQAAIQGSGVLGGSPQNPMYVTVVGQLFGGGTPGPTVPGSGAPPGTPGSPVILPPGTKVPGKSTWYGKLGAKIGQLASGAAGTRIAMLAGAPAGLAAGLATELIGLPFLAAGDQAQGKGSGTALRRAQEIWNKNGNRVTGISDQSIREFTNARGVHEIAMTINIKHPDGTITPKKVHIPVKLWETKPAPTAKGSPNGRR